MQHQYLIGIDIGTSGCKSVIVNELGKIISEAYYEYGMSTSEPGWCEQDPEDWWRAVKITVGRLLKDFPSVQSIKGIGLCGQMHGMVLLDSKGDVIRPCILWCDQRNEKQCQDIQERVGGVAGLLKLTSNKMLTGYTGGKILWTMENEPANFEKTRIILNPKDYIRFRLTGEYATEVSDASGTGLFDVKNRKWSDELLSILGISKELLPSCYESIEISGRLSNNAAEELKLPYGLPVVGGGGDAIVQSIGSGLVKSGVMGATIGTGGQVTANLDSCCNNPEGKLQIFCNVIPGKWHAMGVMLTAGGAFKWLKNLLYEDMKEIDSRTGNVFEMMDKKAENVPVGSERLFFLPYLNGERCPHNDPYARGAFVGLNLRHKKPHLIRSVLEGVAFGLRDLSEVIMELGITPKRIYASGGGANSNLWRQIIAEILNMDVYTMNTAAFGGAYGAALLAGVGTNTWASVEEAAMVMKVKTKNHPENENTVKYNSLFPIYKQLYGSLKEDFRKISKIAEV
ncbi:xylulokinase [Clostridium thermosuccinogenes]|uniref:Xylulose kinase n=1 Tax=Clostridium thermosuccinogenes TaxID=84032 RepID=A0A2K2FL06_9CLOT|nr:xylulokinase [Pseudoclostridium thermosuccinogenes]AUS98708.1 xylulokinase [Pseudoclostridium thermosuccinogenes]PNT99467.1 xylulokinase [Pseudoclostridium thermosuccinogenes]PNU01154.1 xylulokinase [Pseudoclostridium thermosuccinogenes]